MVLYKNQLILQYFTSQISSYKPEENKGSPLITLHDCYSLPLHVLDYDYKMTIDIDGMTAVSSLHHEIQRQHPDCKNVSDIKLALSHGELDYVKLLFKATSDSLNKMDKLLLDNPHTTILPLLLSVRIIWWLHFH